MYNPKSKRTSKQIGAVKKKTLDGLTANKNIDDIIALSKISNTQTKDIGNLNSGLSKVSASVSSKQNKLTLTTTGSSGPATLNNDTLNVPDYSLSLSGFVPYTGATGNVDLGEYEIKVGQVEFDQTPIGTAGVAIMRWNDQDGTIDLGLKGGNVTLQIGQEQVTRVVNKTGSDLLEANYQAVRISGAQGNRLKVDLAQANNDANSADTIGIVTETINNNQEGFVTTSGLVRGINTTGSIQGETWSDGDILYLSGTVAGQLTNIKPAAPIHTVIMGYVVRAHVTQGQIYVKVDNGYELDELHNVAITTPLNDQVLQYESATSLWKNKTISTGITIGTTTITSGTVGRVLFEGAGNVVQESANLFWDATNNRLGIGTSSPTNALTLGAAVAASLQSSAATIFTSNENASNVFSQVAASNDPVQRPVFAGLKSRGTLLSPTAVVAGDSCTTFLSSAFDGTAGQASAALSFDAESNASSGNAPQLISFITGTSGATRTTKMQVRSNGNVLIGTTTDSGFKLDVNGSSTFRGEIRLNANIATGGNRNYLLGNSGDFEVTTNTNIKFRNFYNASDVYFSMNYGSGGRALFSGLTSANGYRLATSGNVIPEAAVARGIHVNNTLVAAANNDVLVGLDITPTFSNGAFTGVTNYVTRLGGHIGVSTANAFGLNYVSFTALTTNQGISAGFSPNGTPTGYAYNFQFAKSSTSNSNGLLFIGGGASASGNSANKHVISTSADGTALGQPLVLRVATTSQSWSLVNDHLTIFPTGNVVIQNASQSATDAGFRFDVNGTSRLQGLTTFGSTNDFLISGTTVVNKGITRQAGNGNGIIFSENMQAGQIAFQFVGGGSLSGNAKPFLNTGGRSVFNINVGLGNPNTNNLDASVLLLDGIHNVTSFSGTIIRGIYYNPTLTSLVGVISHRAIQTTSGDILFGTTSGSVGIGANTLINQSAILDVTSTTQGFLPPRMTNAQMLAIATPAEGLVVYDTTNRKLCCYDGATWQNLF